MDQARALGIDPDDPDPGRVTVRRLNRVEYRNTIRDLIGVDYDVTSEFPSDDTGNGFDNNGDVLTLSPMLLEKYLTAANTIISRAVPTVPKVVAEQAIPGGSFRKQGSGTVEGAPISLSYYEPSSASTTVQVEHDGKYRLILDLNANERFVDGQNDQNRCLVRFLADGEELLRREFFRQDNKPFRFEFDRDYKAGPHTLTIEVQPLAPARSRSGPCRFASSRRPCAGRQTNGSGCARRDYARFFPGEVPRDTAERSRYTREILGRFAEKAFRRAVDDGTKDRLVALAVVSSGDGRHIRGRRGAGDGGRADIAPLPFPRRRC